MKSSFVFFCVPIKSKVLTFVVLLFVIFQMQVAWAAGDFNVSRTNDQPREEVDVKDFLLEEDWKLVKKRKGISVFVRELSEFNMKSFKGEGNVELAREGQHIELVENLPDAANFLAFINKLEEYKEPDGNVHFLRAYTFLPLIKNRDAVIKAVINYQDDGLMVEIINDPEGLPQDKEYVRIPLLEGKFEFKFEDDDKINAFTTYEVALNAGGYVPNKIVALLLKGVPYSTIKKLRKEVKKA